MRMACGPNLVPGRCEVPPSNGAPMITTSAPAHDAASSRSAAGTPRKVTSGPYIPPIRLMITLLGTERSARARAWPDVTPRQRPVPRPGRDTGRAPCTEPRPGPELLRGADRLPGHRGRGLVSVQRGLRQDPFQPPGQPPVGLAQQLHH